MRPTTTNATSIHKVRRDARGGKRGDGWKTRFERIRRPDPRRIHEGKPDATLTGIAGLASFGVFCRERGIDTMLQRRFARLKDGPLVVYPMEAQLRLLLDANIVGEERVFGLESLAPDPLFVRLAGGVVPSIDTVYRDLGRFDEGALRDLEAMMVEQGLASLKKLRTDHVHVDIDTTVECFYGTQQGALPGPNPRYHGRPSYHPMLAYCAEAGVCVGAPCDRAIRASATTMLRCSGAGYVASGRTSLATCSLLLASMPAAIAPLFWRPSMRRALIVKAKWGFDLREAVRAVKRWTSVDWDARGRPTRQVAVLNFARTGWKERGHAFRVVAVRSNERDTITQLPLWADLDYTVQVYITNDWLTEPDEIAWEYNGRAEVEPAIGELKYGWGIGKIPSQLFVANQAVFLLKLLAHNLMRGFVRWAAPKLASWRVPWLRRALINVPGRLIRSGRCWALRVPPGSCVRLD